MRYDWDDHTLLIAHNFSAKPRAFTPGCRAWWADAS